MSGICLKCSLSLLLAKSCVGGLRHYSVGNSSKFALLSNVRGFQYFAKMNPISFGLLAGCCFSKQTENYDSDPIIPECPVEIQGPAVHSDTCEGLLNRTVDYGSLSSDIISGNQRIVDHCLIALHHDDVVSQSSVSSKKNVPVDKTCSTTTYDGAESKFKVPLDSDDVTSASYNAEHAVLQKRSSNEMVDCCESKYQKFTEETEELSRESTANQSDVIDASRSDSGNKITQGVVPQADVKESKTVDITDVTKKKGSSSKKTKKKPKQRPNYFVSMRISNPLIYKSLETVQAYITKQDSRLKPSIVPLDKLHITLMVMHISSTEEHEKALNVLRNLWECLNEDMCKYPLTLEITGLGTFNDKVLFAKIKPSDSLDRLNNIADDVNKHFKEASIPSTDERAFNPHLTVMKLSRAPKLYHQGIKKIDPSLYSLYKDHVFGSEVIKGIELLSMLETDAASGYYKGHQLLFRVDEGCALVAPSLSLSEEIQDKKDKISQLAQRQIKRIISSPSDKSASTDSSSHSDLK